jgi:hypothetical protein
MTTMQEEMPVPNPSSLPDDRVNFPTHRAGKFKIFSLDTYTKKSENLSLTFSEMSPINLPSPWWEGMKGRGDQSVSVLFTPTRTLPRRKGRELFRKFQISLFRVRLRMMARF